MRVPKDIKRSKNLIDIRAEFKRKGTKSDMYEPGVRMRELFNHPSLTTKDRKNLLTKRNEENLAHALGKPEIPAVKKYAKKKRGL